MIGKKITEGKTYLGIELGSTRIKACLIDDSFKPVAGGAFAWENRLENGYWTYSEEDIHSGIKKCYAKLCRDIKEKYGVTLTKTAAMGISGMMHGYLAFDENARLLTPFRTWRNTTCSEAAERLTELFGFNIPQRWSIAQLYQAILNREEHISKIAHITTLSGYIHYLLTGNWEIGACDASGIFPLCGSDYDGEMLDKFDRLTESEGILWKIRNILPKVRSCSSASSRLTEQGAEFLDISGNLMSGCPVCPPEGDCGTGMVATNSVKPNTGNISAGTSVNAMLVLEKPLKGLYRNVDVAATPEAHTVAMIHSNNGCSELDNWVNMFGEFAALADIELDKDKLYGILYRNALKGDGDCGGLVSYNFLASEPVAGIEIGRPMYFRMPDGKMKLSNFFRSQLYSAVAVMKIGLDGLTKNEGLSVESFTAHGGLFKVKGVAQQLLANALNTPITVSETAGEGGAWGMALLAAYAVQNDKSGLGQWLEASVFENAAGETLYPVTAETEQFGEFFKLYKAGLSAAGELKNVSGKI